MFLGLCCFGSASAQLEWKSKGPLYKDRSITVEIEYAMSSDPCGTASLYRYKISKRAGRDDFYVNWRFDYFDCDHVLKSHLNSLRVTRKTKTGYIVPADNQFFALRLANNFNEVKRASHLPQVGHYMPQSPTSMEPEAVSGKLAIKQGEATTLSFEGGYLAGNTVWKWHEGDRGGREVGSGMEITVRPSRTTTYVLCGEGTFPTACITVTVVVANTSMAAAGVTGSTKLCSGEQAALAVSGGHLATGAKWVWYADQCNGTPVGEGTNIMVSPVRTTAYYVRAEGPGGNTDCRVHEVSVTGPSRPAERIVGAESVSYGQLFVLTVQGGELAPDAQWVWYTGPASHPYRLAAGNSYTVASAVAGVTYYVRAEGACFNSAFTSSTVRLKSEPVRPSVKSEVKATYFINGGVVADDPQALNNPKNYVITLGGGKSLGWYVRAKVSAEQANADYGSAGVQLTNYNQPGYYQYNNTSTVKRTAYTGGIYLGSKIISVYIGAGYGSRELLYGIDRYTYEGNYSIGTAWVKNTGSSFTGAEGEGGLLLRVDAFNVMGGVSTIQGKYTDYHLGIGFNF